MGFHHPTHRPYATPVQFDHDRAVLLSLVETGMPLQAYRGIPLTDTGFGWSALLPDGVTLGGDGYDLGALTDEIDGYLGIECATCNALGYVIDQPTPWSRESRCRCPDCDGSGWRREPE